MKQRLEEKKSMNARFVILAALVLVGSLSRTAAGAVKMDPELTSRLSATPATKQLGVILTFNGQRVTDAQVNAVKALGITMGVRMRNFPIMGVNATPTQIRQMANLAGLRSIYLNTQLQLYMNQTRPIIGVTRLQTDSTLTARNHGLPFSGRGVTIAIDDSGIDGSHADVKFDPINPMSGKTIQNVIVNPNDQDGLVVRTNALGNVMAGILPATYVENVINTDTHVGHGTHCAGIAAGTGMMSGGLYAGVAPGAKLVGLGSGGVLFVLGQISALDYAYTNQFNYNIRVISNSWGNSAVATDPDHPVNVATKMLHDLANIVVVFANGNDGPHPNSQNRWASFPWLITAGASTKDWKVASFSSRGIFGDPVIHPTVLTPGTGGPAEAGFSAAVVSTRSTSNLVANGLNEDAEIPSAYLPYYTQISGTSMACPHLAGIVAMILEANPSLTADDVKAIIEQTSTPMATYDQYEAGTGMANVHAAVDLALNPSKAYGNFGFVGKGLTLQTENAQTYAGTVPGQGSASVTFTVPPNARFAFVQLDWGAVAGEDAAVIDNTQPAAQDLALSVEKDGQVVASSDNINLAGFFGSREGIKLEFPGSGVYTATVSASLAGLGAPANQAFTVTVNNYTYDPSSVTDLSALTATARQNARRLIYDRVMLTNNNLFRPDDPLTRIEMGRALMFSAHVMQYLPDSPSFNDIEANSPEQLIAESLKRENVMGRDSGFFFKPNAQVSRVDEAVALVRALRLDMQAKGLANHDVTSGGQTLIDNAQIPGELRGYVQIALDKGLLQAFPAQVIQDSPGHFTVIPGPRFEPMMIVKRADFIDPATKLLAMTFGE
jgi:serine protease AprX